MCNFFQKAYPRNIDKKRFGYPYPVPVWKQFFDILIRVQLTILPDIQPLNQCQAKFLTCEISDFTPCTHAQSNIVHTKYADKTDYQGLGICV